MSYSPRGYRQKIQKTQISPGMKGKTTCCVESVVELESRRTSRLKGSQPCGTKPQTNPQHFQGVQKTPFSYIKIFIK